MFDRRRAKQRIAAEAELLAETPDGCLVHVTGVVRTLEMVLRSPTTGRSVVAYSVRVAEPSRREPGGFVSTEPFACTELVPFAVEHATLGRIVIDSQFANLVLPEHRAEKLHDRYWTDFCDERQLSPSSSGIERPLLAGAKVTVLGTTLRRTARPGGDAGFRDGASALCLVGDFDHPLLILDED